MSELLPGLIFPPEILLSGLFVVVFACIVVYARAVPQGGRSWWIAATSLVALLVAAFQVEGLLRTLLLDLSVLAAVALVWSGGTPRSHQAARLYLVLALAGMACVTAGLALTGRFSAAEAVEPPAPLAQLAVALLVTGFALKLALLPLYFWLPEVAAASTPMTTALIMATLDISEFSELFELRASLPWVFEGHTGLWLGIALLSMFGGAFLALAQTDLKKMLAFSTIDDFGYLLIGILAGTQAGLLGAFLGALSHAVFKVILFGSVGVAERGTGQPVTLSSRGLAARYPLSSACFIVAALGFLGVPPLFGFPGRWRLYLSGLELGGIALGIAMALATALALLYYVRAIHRVWLGAPSTGETLDIPKQAPAMLVALAVFALLLGLFPQLLTGGML